MGDWNKWIAPKLAAAHYHMNRLDAIDAATEKADEKGDMAASERYSAAHYETLEAMATAATEIIAIIAERSGGYMDRTIEEIIAEELGDKLGWEEFKAVRAISEVRDNIAEERRKAAAN